MAEDLRDLYYHQPFHEASAFGYTNSSSISSNAYMNPQLHQQDYSVIQSSHMLDPSFMSFSECLLQGSSHDNNNNNNNHSDSISRAFGGLSDAFTFVKDQPTVMDGGGGGETTPATPNSSISSSSTEAVGDDQLDTTNNKAKKDKQHLKDASSSAAALQEDEESPKKE